MELRDKAPGCEAPGACKMWVRGAGGEELRDKTMLVHASFVIICEVGRAELAFHERFVASFG